MALLIYSLFCFYIVLLKKILVTEQTLFYSKSKVIVAVIKSILALVHIFFNDIRSIFNYGSQKLGLTLIEMCTADRGHLRFQVTDW